MGTIDYTENDHTIRSAKQCIRNIIAQSPVPEDPGHAENTLQWLLRIAPDAGVAQQLAALAHDIERARPDRLSRNDFDSYDAFKTQHAALSATITDAILAKVNVSVGIRQSVRQLITRHEHGGDPLSDLLKDADSLSYFDYNLPFYYQREGWSETLRRARWGYRRLSRRAQDYYCDIRPDSLELQQLLREASSL